MFAWSTSNSELGCVFMILVEASGLARVGWALGITLVHCLLPDRTLLLVGQIDQQKNMAEAGSKVVINRSVGTWPSNCNDTWTLDSKLM